MVPLIVSPNEIAAYHYLKTKFIKTICSNGNNTRLKSINDKRPYAVRNIINYPKCKFKYQFRYFHNKWHAKYAAEILHHSHTIRHKIIIIATMFRRNTLRLRYINALKYLLQFVTIKPFNY